MLEEVRSQTPTLHPACRRRDLLFSVHNKLHAGAIFDPRIRNKFLILLLLITPSPCLCFTVNVFIACTTGRAPAYVCPPHCSDVCAQNASRSTGPSTHTTIDQLSERRNVFKKRRCSLWATQSTVKQHQPSPTFYTYRPRWSSTSPRYVTPRTPRPCIRVNACAVHITLSSSSLKIYM